MFGDVVGELLLVNGEIVWLHIWYGFVEVVLIDIVVVWIALLFMADELALEVVVVCGWCFVEIGVVGGWVLWVSGGFIGWVNSVFFFCVLGWFFDEVFEVAHIWYVECRLFFWF